MKVKFNLPISRHNSKLNFDFNTTFDFGSIQSSLCQFTLPSAKYSINLNQLVRTAPLAVPTFGRMAVHNVFAYVPMSLIYPAFDAFLSQTLINGTTGSYTPLSLPVISNRLLVCMLLSNNKFSRCYTLKSDANKQLTINEGYRYFNDGIPRKVERSALDVLPTGTDPFKLVWDYKICDTVGDTPVLSLYKLTNLGRQFYSLFRSLGYSMDYADTSYVSVLPILAYCKAVFDLLYPHRDTPWHAMDIYNMINRYYNGYFDTVEVKGHSYDIFITSSDYNPSDQQYYDFLTAVEPFLIAPVGSDITQVATASPILPTSKSPNFDGITFDAGGVTGRTNKIVNDNLIPSIEDPVQVSADSLRLVDKLWSFVQRSSVVGQDVLDWFKVHFGAKPSEDMFCQSFLIKDVVNLLNVNTVVSSADTSAQNGEVLGGLAGQSYSADSAKVSFQAPNFGFLLCLSYVVPVCRPANGTQPYLYNVGYYDMPFPDFDGLGYESLNALSFQAYSDATGPKGKNTGFGFVPRLSSYKIYNNVTSGGFSLPSLRDNYLPYCLDNFVQLVNYNGHFDKDMLKLGIVYTDPVTSETLHWYYPYPDVTYKGTTLPRNIWRIFDNIFYNNSDYSDVWQLAWSPNNFMCQSSFEVNISSYLKPISDSFEIDDLFKNVTSVHKS